MYYIQGHAWIWDGETWIDFGSVVGPQGPTGSNGDQGVGLVLKGTKPTEGDLPASGNAVGDTWTVSGIGFTWNGTAWVNIGQFQGLKGDRGNYWILLERNPTASDGVQGDLALNTLDQTVWQKTSTTAWSQQPGHLGGGNVYEAPTDGQNYVRNTNNWVVLPVGEAPDDAKNYIRKSKAWVEMPAPTVQEAPVDTSYYVRSSGAWKKFDRYDLNTVTSTATLDASVANAFNVDLSVTRNLSITNLPAGRTMAIPIKFFGNAGSVTWTNTIHWLGGSAPVFGAAATLIVLHWDGSSLIGLVSGNY